MEVSEQSLSKRPILNTLRLHALPYEILLIEEMGVIMGQQNVFELISAPYPAELSEAVNAKLAEGWQLFGHPFSAEGDFYQAVVGRLPDDKRLRKTTADDTSAKG